MTTKLDLRAAGAASRSKDGDRMNKASCCRCGHPQDWHRHDDADSTPPTAPNCKFRCMGYDCMKPGLPPKTPCGCPDFVRG